MESLLEIMLFFLESLMKMAFELLRWKKSKYNINKKKKVLDGNTKKIFVEWSVYRNNVNIENLILKWLAHFLLNIFIYFSIFCK